jgi:hypothetical protein
MIRIGSTILALLAILALGACSVEGSGTTSDGTPPPGDSFVEVVLDEFSIEMPTMVSSGEVAFQISNSGDMEHSFSIEGPGVQEELDAPIAPGGTFNLTVDLEPGTYTVWCPIGNHRDQGMELTFEVTDGPMGSGAPLNEDGVTPSEGQAPIDETDY